MGPMKRSELGQRLLAQIATDGWSERRAARFEELYSEQIHWVVVATMERIGALQWRIHPSRVGDCLEDRRLALYQNTISDLWFELLNGLVDRYFHGTESGEIHQEFVPYLRGVIRHLVVANARTLRLIGRETTAEMLSAVCEAKRSTTYVDRLAWLKFCLENRVRQEILTRVGAGAFARVYRQIHRVCDYFFEEFVPSQCERISASRSMLGELLDEFSLEADADAACNYVGTITPVAREIDESSRAAADVDESEFLGALRHARSQGFR